MTLKFFIFTEWQDHDVKKREAGPHNPVTFNTIHHGLIYSKTTTIWMPFLGLKSWYVASKMKRNVLLGYPTCYWVNFFITSHSMFFFLSKTTVFYLFIVKRMISTQTGLDQVWLIQLNQRSTCKDVWIWQINTKSSLN